MTRRHFSSLSSPSVCFYLHVCVVEFLIFDIDTLMNTKYSDKCLVGKICQGSLVNKSSPHIPHEIWTLGGQYYQVPSQNIVQIDIEIEDHQSVECGAWQRNKNIFASLMIETEAG